MKKIPKKWRELPKEERFKIPLKHFNINKKTLTKIREIPNVKEKLIAAAKLQYELFNDIHSYLTVWIAGYGSDVMIRQKFGSTQNLLNLFIKPNKFPKEINPSWADIKRKIKIPEKMTEELSEEIGIHIGDGNVYVCTNKQGGKSFQYTVSGDLTNEEEYHNYIKELMKKIYNIDTSILKRINKNNIDSRIKSKSIIEFKNKILGLPIGKKKNIKIPKEIMNNKEFSRRCAVGIIDTDFSITSSLSITGKLHSLIIIKQLSEILNKENIPYNLKIYEDYGRFYIRKEGAIKIIKEWKLKNPKHLSKFNLFKEFKKFIPYSTTPERLAVLRGELSINKLEEICKKRKMSRGTSPRFPFTHNILSCEQNSGRTRTYDLSVSDK